MDNFNPGGILKVDPRNFSLEKAHELLGSATARPDSVNPPKIEQVWQSQFPACGAHSGSHLKEVQENIETGISQKLSPSYLWKRIKQIDGFKPEDGTDMSSILEVLKSNGVCDYSILPNDYTQSLSQYTDASVITPIMDENAQPRIISSYAFCTDLSFDNLKTQIWLNKAVLLLIQCDNGFFRTDVPTFTTRPYGHFVVATGYDANGIYVQDSTEKEHPVKYIKNQYASFVIQAGTAIDLPDEIVKQLVVKVSLYQKLLGLYQQLFKK